MPKIQNLFKLSIILHCLNIIDGKSDQDLCELCPKGRSSEHIFCLFPSPGPADNSKCSQVDNSITNAEFRNKVLDWHNNYRNKFAEGTWKGKDSKGQSYSQDTKFPRAANMRLLMYDYQLEKLAMRNVQNCYYNHEPCRTVERFKYGQNLGYEANSNKDHVPKDSEGIWEAWVAEMKDYDIANLPEFGKVQKDGVVVGHFTAATWATSRVIGCAQAHVFDGEFYRIDVACDYGPAGNIMRKPMYVTGTPGSNCPKGTKAGYNSTYPNLCGGVDPEDEPYFDPAIAKSVRLYSDFGVLFFLVCVEIFNIFFI